METLFSGDPLASVRFFDAETNDEIAYVVLEDEGDYWSILASMEEGAGSIMETIEKDLFHPDPRSYAQQMYREAAIMVDRLLSCRAVVRVEADGVKAVMKKKEEFLCNGLVKLIRDGVPLERIDGRQIRLAAEQYRAEYTEQLEQENARSLERIEAKKGAGSPWMAVI